MKRFSWAAAFLAAAAIARADGVAWESDYAKGVEKAKETGKLLHVHFAADWCGPCKELDKEVFHNEVSAKYFNETFVNVLIDVDKDPDTTKKFKVGPIPDTRILDVSGKELLRIIGNQPDFFEQVRSFGDLKAVEKSVKDNPKDLKTLIAAADFYTKIGRLPDAGELLEKAIELDEETKAQKRVELFYRLGLVNLKAGHSAEADAAWAEVAKMDRENKQGFIDDLQFERCKKQTEEEDYFAAERSLSDFLNRYADSEHVPEAKFLLGRSQFFSDKLEDAISTWKDLIREKPGTEAAKKAETGLKFAEKKNKK
jgi:tetratricopeptide (TPR) repeat protein